ncbi:hypothetical protein [Verrucosispora sp. WMMD1129]|uniref:hypothetical protein n=1 Tax=Verrucosispora sp. WMMD1129 TaxID=3016093 RepID=UPI00249AF6B0|nr:hypothetical protein [Verrucosispora sp. WMMD1129]WFE46282.1 hypothetical protein O7624_18990 [Verrucosispora sp. WMMD1129]
MTTPPLANGAELVFAAADQDWPTVEAIVRQGPPDLLMQTVWVACQLIEVHGLDDALRARLRAALAAPDAG